MGLDATGAEQQVRAWLEARDLDVTTVREGRVMTMLTGQWKRTIHVLLHVDSRSLHATSLLVGEPDQHHEEVYRLLLHRNQKSGPVHFALDDDGQVVLTGDLALDHLDEEGFDVLLGTILRLADDVFNTVLRTGFADYLAKEQAWREQAGMPPNPAGTEG